MRIFSDDPNFVFYVKGDLTINDVAELKEYAQIATDTLKSEGYTKTQRTFESKQAMINYAKAL